MWGQPVLVITAITIHFNFFFFFLLMNKKEYIKKRKKKTEEQQQHKPQLTKPERTDNSQKKAKTPQGWPDKKTQNQTLHETQTTNHKSYPTSKTSTRRPHELTNHLLTLEGLKPEKELTLSLNCNNISLEFLSFQRK